jgi:hypothetical protein
LVEPCRDRARMVKDLQVGLVEPCRDRARMVKDPQVGLVAMLAAASSYQAEFRR